MHRSKMGQNINYVSNSFDYYVAEDQIEYSFAIIFPEFYLDSIQNVYWRHRDMDLIEESLGISLCRVSHC